MQGIGFSSPLTIKQERRLFFAIKVWHREMRREKTQQEEQPSKVQYLRRRSEAIRTSNSKVIRNGVEAQNEIVSTHLPLVEEIVRKLYRKNRFFLADIHDLLSAGEEGLMTAIYKFRGKRYPSKSPSTEDTKKTQKTRFATFAVWPIMSAISKAIRDHRWMIGIPSQMHRRVIRLVKERRKLQRSLMRPPTLAELAESLHLHEATVGQLLFWVAPQCVSLETPIGDDGRLKVKDLIIDKSISPPNMSAELTLLHEGFGRMLATLSDRERSVIEGRFGLDGKGEQTQEDLAFKLELSPQAISAIEQRALQKIREAWGEKRPLPRRSKKRLKRRKAAFFRRLDSKKTKETSG